MNMAEMQAPMRNVSLRDNSSRVMPHLAHGHAHDMNMDMDMDMDMDLGQGWVWRVGVRVGGWWELGGGLGTGG